MNIFNLFGLLNKKSQVEVEKKFKIYPRFKSKDDNDGIKRIKEHIKSDSEDTVYISTSRFCPECSVYNKRVFSIYGKEKHFPKLPKFLENSICPTCGHYIGVTRYFVKISGNLKKDIAFSNRPFVDQRTSYEKEIWNKTIKEQSTNAKISQDYQWISTNLPELAPKTIGGYKRMMTANSTSYKKIVLAAKEKGYDI